MEISTKVFALGNSNAIRLPRLVMEAMGLKAEEPITLELVNNQELIVRKETVQKEYPSIKELFAGYHGGYRPAEADGDDGVGREVI